MAFQSNAFQNNAFQILGMLYSEVLSVISRFSVNFARKGYFYRVFSVSVLFFPILIRKIRYKILIFLPIEAVIRILSLMRFMIELTIAHYVKIIAKVVASVFVDIFVYIRYKLLFFLIISVQLISKAIIRNLIGFLITMTFIGRLALKVVYILITPITLSARLLIMVLLRFSALLKIASDLITRHIIAKIEKIVHLMMTKIGR